MAATGAVWASMPMLCNSNDHCSMRCPDEWPIRLFAVDAIAGSWAECHRPNCYVAGTYLWRWHSVWAASYHSVSCNGHCCRSKRWSSLSGSRNSCRHCMVHWIFCWPQWHRWKTSIRAPCDRRNRFVLTHRWLATRRADCDTIDFHPTAEWRKWNWEWGKLISLLLSLHLRLPGIWCCPMRILWEFLSTASWCARTIPSLLKTALAIDSQQMSARLAFANLHASKVAQVAVVTDSENRLLFPVNANENSLQKS